MTFKNGTTTMGTLMLSAGKAILQTAKLPAGTLTITASYNGDVKNAKSLGATTQTVNKATTKTTLSLVLKPIQGRPAREVHGNREFANDRTNWFGDLHGRR